MKKIITILSLLALFSVPAFSQMGIGTTAPDGSAMLDVVSNAKGLLAPRMTTAERTAIPSPADGLLVYDTDFHSFWFFKNGTWTDFGSGGGLWSRTGTNTWLTNTGDNVGIGTTDPQYGFDLSGTARILSSGTLPIAIEVDPTSLSLIKIITAGPGWSASRFIDFSGNFGGSMTGIRFDSLGVVRTSILSNGNSRMYLNGNDLVLNAANQNIGIGTSNPTVKLHINTTSNPLRLEGLQTSSQSDVLVVDGNGVVTKRSGGFGSDWTLSGNSLTGTEFLGSTNSQPVKFYSNNSERMRITEAGNVGIGVTDPLERMHLSGNTRISGTMGLFGGTNNSNYAMNIGDLAGGQRGINLSTNEPSGTTYGLYYSHYNENSTSGISYGTYMDVEEYNPGRSFHGHRINAWGNKIRGLYLTLNADLDNARIYSVYNSINSNGLVAEDQRIYGVYNRIYSKGIGTKGYGMYNWIMGDNSADGSNPPKGFGIYSLLDCVDQPGKSILYGEYIDIMTHMPGDVVYGTYIRDSLTYSGATHYGHYIDLDGAGTNYSIYVTPTSGNSYFGSRVGIGITSPSNALHINSTNPIRLEGLQTSTQSDVLVVDANGVVTTNSTIAGGAALWSRTGTNTWLTNTGDKVGIGTTDPLIPVHTYGEDNAGLYTGTTGLNRSCQTLGQYRLTTTPGANHFTLNEQTIFDPSEEATTSRIVGAASFIVETPPTNTVSSTLYNLRPLQTQVLHYGTGTIGSTHGYISIISTGSSGGAFTTARGIQATASVSTGNINDYIGLVSASDGTITGTGTVTRYLGISTGQPYNTAGSTSTTGGYFAIGLRAYVGNQGGNTSGTNINRGIYITGNGGSAGSGGTIENHAIYSSSTADSYFAGEIGIGTTSPQTPLHAVGTSTPAARMERVISDTIVSKGYSQMQLYNPDITRWNYSALNFSSNDSSGTLKVGGGIQCIYTARGQAYLNGDMAFMLTNTLHVGVERMRIKNNGFVGIGTSDPTNKLHITGIDPLRLPGLVTNTTDNTVLVTTSDGVIQKRSLENIGWGLEGNSLTGTEMLGSTNNRAVIMITNNTERMRLTGSGRLGIGQTNPLSPLHVVSATVPAARFERAMTDTVPGYSMLQAYNPDITRKNYSSMNFVTNDSSGALRVANGIYSIHMLRSQTNIESDLAFVTIQNNTTPVENIRIKYNGNVGIGNSAPTQKLDVTGNGLFSGSVTATSINASQIVRLTPLATAPSSPVEGEMYMDASTHKLRVYDGTTWQDCW